MKRRYPFQDGGSFHQKKVHVGLKELDLGVDSNRRLPIVYEKTVNALFKNARDNAKIIFRRQHCSNNDYTLPSRRGKQMTLDSDMNGRLLGHVLPQSSRLFTTNANICAYCTNNGQLKSANCSFCEKPICSSCCQQCIRCCEVFCPLCSIKSYQEKEDTAICFSCSYL
ncbi:hypothetical protein CHUAL_003290 [Chamberlinius hualienensis]